MGLGSRVAGSGFKVSYRQRFLVNSMDMNSLLRILITAVPNYERNPYVHYKSALLSLVLPTAHVITDPAVRIARIPQSLTQKQYLSPFLGRPTRRVQVLNNHILAQNLYHDYYYPNPKYLNIGYLDP